MVRKLLLPFLLLLATPAQADRVGIPTPMVWTTCSPNGAYCARLDPVSNSISVYSAGASVETLWTMTGWSGVAARPMMGCIWFWDMKG